MQMTENFIYVLVPHLETDDENISYYYDFSQSIAEYTKLFAAWEVDWKWQPVTMKDQEQVINTIIEESKTSTKLPLVLNLCDGDEVNGTPGIAVVRMLEKNRLAYTGSEEYFYGITTSKGPMKKAFDHAGVPTAKWAMISSMDDANESLFEQLGSPIILKPAVSGGSMGVGVRNVVYNLEQLKIQLEKMLEGYRGWNLSIDGVIAEEFINGREFTTLITGSARHPNQCRVYDPVERVFHPSLPAHEKFLSFDRLWEIYEEEAPMPAEENFYAYHPVDKALAEKMRDLSMEAYAAVNGTGYTRIDLRMDQETGAIKVLEVNAQCGLSEDEDYTSIGAILRVNGTSFGEMMLEIFQDAFTRKSKKWD